MGSAFGRLTAQTQPRPTFKIEAGYVRVDMYATEGDKVVEDLRPEEIELLEDGVPQKIESFEHVKVRPGGPQDARREPSGIRESREMAADPRARVLVVFLDTFHTQVDGSYRIGQPLVNLLEKAVGDDDLVGLMHPRMSATHLTLGRKTTVIQKLLRREWTWGERSDGIREPLDDPDEQQWYVCFPKEVADEMKVRRREKLALDALEDLIIHLRGIREERKAVLLVSEGWRLFRPSESLTRLQSGDEPPKGPGIFVGGTGRITTRNPRELGGVTKSECDSARMELSNMDHSRRLIDLAHEANRGNVTFYPVYPRGLQVTDTSMISHQTAGDMTRSMRALSNNLDQLRLLADNTDGLAVVNTNDLEGAMKRIVSDLTSYYLLGYYSSNAKLDGQFREIKVRVKRPGVQVRARRGYRAATPEEVTAVSRTAAVVARSTVDSILYEPDRIVNPVNRDSLRHVVLWKRGPSTGPKYVASTEVRFRRTERMRLEHAAPLTGDPAARMVDRDGRPMAVPVQVSERPDASGEFRWVVVDATLAPLAPGEYGIELTIGEHAVRTVFTIIP